jgi:hypothetical protein
MARPEENISRGAPAETVAGGRCWYRVNQTLSRIKSRVPMDSKPILLKDGTSMCGSVAAGEYVSIVIYACGLRRAFGRATALALAAFSIS